MTKVWMSPYFLEYQWGMKDALRQVIQENYIGGVREAERGVPVLSLEHLLPVPRIMCISLHAYEGQEDDFIGIVAHHDFGIHAMHITILDEDGNRIECGEASPFSYDPELWGYLGPRGKHPKRSDPARLTSCEDR